MKCLNCGKDTGRNKYYCYQKCRVEHIRNKKKCEVCGKYFYVSPSSEKKTCSKECAHILKSNDGKFGAAKNNVKLAQIAAITSPNSGSFETNAIAKSWKIQSPNGTIYDINNLSLWAKEHEDLLPGTVIQFVGGIRDIKRTKQGKKKRGSQQYKGWELLEWSEENKARIKNKEDET